MFRISVFAVIAFAVGSVATYAAVFFGTLSAWNLLGGVDRHGGGSMGGNCDAGCFDHAR